MITRSAIEPLEIHVFCPLRMNFPPDSSKDVFREAGSLPAAGSVSPNAITFSPFVVRGRYLPFCSSLPHFCTVSSPSDTCAETKVLTPVPSLPILSIARA